MRNQPLQIIEKFSPQAAALRAEFENRFVDPMSLDSNRFVWDYWHVPGQYSLLRTPAYHYFSQKIYLQLHNQLVAWGRANLGCWDISPPWLSCYVEGHEQKLHADVPHGPWAFVLSLTPTAAKFTGGETTLLREHVLQYWRSQSRTSSYQTADLVQAIAPKFNRLIVFDGRIPHGVSRVGGVQDPREGRLVLHGWFSQPKTYIDGSLPKVATERRLNQAVAEVQAVLDSNVQIWGTLALRLDVSSSGRVIQAQFLTLSVRDEDGQLPKSTLSHILRIYRSLDFPHSRGQTRIIVPLIFST